MTGELAPAGKPALLAMQIWQDVANGKGGLLGRPVKLVYYDDQSDLATIPGIYTKLLDVDKVDLMVSVSGTEWATTRRYMRLETLGTVSDTPIVSLPGVGD